MQEYRLFLLRKGLKPATIELYLKALKPLQNKTPHQIQTHINELLLSGKSASYVNSVTRACILYGEFTNCEELATLRLVPNRKKTLKSTLTDQQIEDLLALPKPKTVSDKTWERWNLFFSICAYQGTRAGEVANLKWSDILLEQRKIAIYDSKSPSGIRFAPLSPVLLGKLSTYIQKFNVGHPVTSSDYIFGKGRPPLSSEWSSAFRQRKKMLGITDPHITTHSLRHSFATRLLSNEVSLPVVMKAMGHSKAESTLVYTHLITADVEKALLRDPLNFHALTFEQILESFERVFDELVKRYTHKVDITYTKTATGLKIEVRKPARTPRLEIRNSGFCN